MAVISDHFVFSILPGVSIEEICQAFNGTIASASWSRFPFDGTFAVIFPVRIVVRCDSVGAKFVGRISVVDETVHKTQGAAARWNGVLLPYVIPEDARQALSSEKVAIRIFVSIRRKGSVGEEETGSDDD